jgi:hypothetical protein
MLSPTWRKFLLWFLVIIPGVPMAISISLYTAYVFWPLSYTNLDVQSIKPETRHLVVLSHGLGDNTTSWGNGLKRVLEDQHLDSQVISVDWNPWSNNALRCAVDGRRIGNQLGENISRVNDLESIHLIAHSCGSFISYGICETLKESKHKLKIQTTYLDPVAIYAGIFWNFGLHNFGSCGDFSDAYIDIEDGVPGSNELIPNTHTFDVTEARKARNYLGKAHVWPTVFYHDNVALGLQLRLRDNPLLTDEYPSGQLSKVTR